MADAFKHNVDILGMGQPNEATCWHASYRMMFMYSNARPQHLTRGSKPRASMEVCTAGRTRRHGIPEGSSSSRFTGWSGKRFNADPSLLELGVSDGAEEFLSELRLGPLWVSRK